MHRDGRYLNYGQVIFHTYWHVLLYDVWFACKTPVFYAVLNNVRATSRVVHFLIKEKGLMVNAIGINEMHPGF